MTTERTYFDIHILQTVPPSNLNRDDAGSPKHAVYGGVRRARVSSQAWKRATRKRFTDHLPKEQLATRTHRAAAMLGSRLAERVGLEPEEATKLAVKVLDATEFSMNKQEKRGAETAYLLFFGRPQLDQLVELLADRADEFAAMEKAALKSAVQGPVKDVLSNGHPIDVALFGRMVADLPGLNVDAATQVAHALSTHQAEIQFDYYTAVDDEKDRAQGDDAGAGMIGTIEFNSATLYRFATVGLHQLAENLGGDPEATATALRMFLECFARSMPTGHENSFAHRTLPNLVSVVVRDDQPVNLVSAFESPVQANGRGLAEQSAVKLATAMRQANDQWGLAPLLVSSMYDTALAESAADVLGASKPFSDVVAEAVEVARGRLAAGASA